MRSPDSTHGEERAGTLLNRRIAVSHQAAAPQGPKRCGWNRATLDGVEQHGHLLVVGNQRRQHRFTHLRRERLPPARVHQAGSRGPIAQLHDGPDGGDLHIGGMLRGEQACQRFSCRRIVCLAEQGDCGQPLIGRRPCRRAPARTIARAWLPRALWPSGPAENRLSAAS